MIPEIVEYVVLDVNICKLYYVSSFSNCVVFVVAVVVSRRLWIFPGVHRCTAPHWSLCSASPYASSCGSSSWRTRGALCPGCSSSHSLHTTYGTACATACGSGPSPTRRPFPTGSTSPSQRLSLISVQCSCTWLALETWSPPSTEWPLMSDTSISAGAEVCGYGRPYDLNKSAWLKIKFFPKYTSYFIRYSGGDR